MFNKTIRNVLKLYHYALWRLTYGWVSELRFTSCTDIIKMIENLILCLF